MPFVSFFLIAFVVVYMSYHIISVLSDPLRTVDAVIFMVEDSIPANGWFVRGEVLMPRADGITQPAVRDGERLARGDTAFYIYHDRSAIELTDDLTELSRRIRDMEYVTEHTAANLDVSQLDRLIYARVTDMLNARDSGNRAAVVSQGLEFKSLVFRREYTYGQGADLTVALEALKAQERMLLSERETAVSEIKADRSGMFTTEVDGYEETFDMNLLDTVTLAELRNPRHDPRLVREHMGKQIPGFSWGHIITVPEDDVRLRLRVGQTLTLRFTDIARTVVDFRIRRIHYEDGQAIISLTTTSNAAVFINTRRLPSDVVLNSYNGLRVPKEAIRLVNDRTGVYCLVGSRAVFKPVDIISERDNYYLVAFDPITARASQLLPGDKMIVAAKDIYDGKVYARN
jgi:hypothetical protein